MIRKTAANSPPRAPSPTAPGSGCWWGRCAGPEERPPPSGGRFALRRPLSSPRGNVPSPEGNRSPKKGNVPSRSWNIPPNWGMFQFFGRNIPQSVGTLSLSVGAFPKPLEHSPAGLEHSPKVWNVLPGPGAAPRKRGDLLPFAGAIVPGGEISPSADETFPHRYYAFTALRGLSRHPLRSLLPPGAPSPPPGSPCPWRAAGWRSS
jgi:hypothetical protein